MVHSARKTMAIVMSAALLLAASGCGAPAAVAAGADAQSPAPGIQLTAQTPQRGDMALSTAFVGTVQPDQVVSVLPKMNGIVSKVNVTVGQQVKKGDLLLTLDDKDLLPTLNEAQASYDSTKAQMDQRVGSGFKSSLATADSAYDQAFDAYEKTKEAVDAAEGDLERAQQKLEDLKKVEPPDLVAIAEASAAVKMAAAAADKSDAMMDSARKGFNNAKNSYNALKTDGEVELKAVVDAGLTQAEAGLARVKQQLENTKVYAPIDGVVESIAVTELNMAAATAPAFVISNKSALAVSFNVSSASVAAMKVGDTVTVEKGQNKYPAAITEVSNIVNPQTGLFTVKAALETTGEDLLTGVTVKVSADTQKAENALLVSQDSLYYNNGKPYVYLMTDGENGEMLATKTFVETGISNPELIEIVSGISESDMVITSWHPNLLDGVVVTLAPQEG